MSNLLDLIKQLRELAEKATPGVWIKDFSDVIQVGGEAIGTCERYDNAYPNAEFIAVSRTAIPTLCDALEKAIPIPGTLRKTNFSL